MDIRGRWGFCVNDWMRLVGGIRYVTPGKWVLKKVGTLLGSDSRREKCEEGRKRVHVKDPFCSLLAVVICNLVM